MSCSLIFNSVVLLLLPVNAALYCSALLNGLPVLSVAISSSMGFATSIVFGASTLLLWPAWVLASLTVSIMMEQCDKEKNLTKTVVWQRCFTGFEWKIDACMIMLHTMLLLLYATGVIVGGLNITLAIPIFVWAAKEVLGPCFPVVGCLSRCC